MRLRLNYTVKLGKDDSNDDVFERVVESTDADIEKAFKKAVMTGTEFDEVPELQALCSNSMSIIPAAFRTRHWRWRRRPAVRRLLTKTARSEAAA